MGRRLRALAALGGAELGVLARAGLLLPLAGLGLRLAGFERFERALRRPVAPRLRPLPGTGDTAERVVRLVAAASRHHPLPSRCLARALVGRRILAGRGIAAELSIGARLDGAPHDGTRLAAHAWLETDRGPCGEPPGVEVEFRPLRPARRALRAERRG